MTQELMKLKKKKNTDHKHDKYITTPEFNKVTAESFAARLAQANLITKTDFDAKLSRLNRKITSNKAKHLLVENQLKKLKSFDLVYFLGKIHFDKDGAKKLFSTLTNFEIFYIKQYLEYKMKVKTIV